MGFSNQRKMLWKSMSHSKMGCHNLSVRFHCEWTPALEMSGVWGAVKRSATNPKFSSWKEANEKAWKTLSWRRSKARGVDHRTLKKENYSRRRSQIMQEGMKGGFFICEKRLIRYRLFVQRIKWYTSLNINWVYIIFEHGAKQGIYIHELRHVSCLLGTLMCLENADTQ